MEETAPIDGKKPSIPKCTATIYTSLWGPYAAMASITRAILTWFSGYSSKVTIRPHSGKISIRLCETDIVYCSYTTQAGSTILVLIWLPCVKFRSHSDAKLIFVKILA